MNPKACETLISLLTFARERVCLLWLEFGVCVYGRIIKTSLKFVRLIPVMRSVVILSGVEVRIHLPTSHDGE